MAGLRTLGLVLASVICAYWIGFAIYIDSEPDLQCHRSRGVAQDLGPQEDCRAIVTWTLGAAPLSYYLDDGTSRISGGEPVKLRELDVISDNGAAPDTTPPVRRPSRCSPQITSTDSPSPLPSWPPDSPQLRALRHLPTGFAANFVLLGKPAALGGLRRSQAGEGRATQAHGLPPVHGPERQLEGGFERA